MKSSRIVETHPDAERAVPSRRRSLLLGAGAAGAAVIAAKTLPIAPVEAAAPTAKAAPEAGGGYQLTQHVLRYYETTKV